MDNQIRPDKFKGINDYKLYEALGKNPIMMAMRIIELENKIKQYIKHSDPNQRQAFIERLKSAALISETDSERGHTEADEVLLEMIDDAEIEELYVKVKKWYS